MESTQESSATSSGGRSLITASKLHEFEERKFALEKQDHNALCNENDNKSQEYDINMDGSGNGVNNNRNSCISNENANKTQELSPILSSQQQPMSLFILKQKQQEQRQQQETSPKKIAQQPKRRSGFSMPGSDGSTESGDETYNMKVPNCTHFKKAINTQNLKKLQRDRLSDKCNDCQKLGILDSQEEEYNDPTMWVCLFCGNVACGRSQMSHAIEHYKVPRSDMHCLVMDTVTWSLWCYRCDDTVNIQNHTQKKKVQEITELLKKCSKAKQQVKPKPPIALGHSEIPNLLVNENKNKTIGLPKIGGLVNLGNTCFFNSVLQCLAQTPYLIHVLDELQVPNQKFVLLGGKHKVNDDEVIELPSIEGVLEKPITFTPDLRKTLSDMQNSQGQVYRPDDLYYSLRKTNNYCTDGGQHDAHELLRHLLDSVRNEDVRRYQTVILERLGLSEKSNPRNVDGNLKSQVKFYGNQAHAKFLGPERAFRGELVSTLECLECGHTSTREEPFLDLSLPVLVDKSLPVVIKRKINNIENSVDSMGNSLPAPLPKLSKHQMKKAQKAAKRAGKHRNRGNSSPSNINHTLEESKDSLGASDESDADVEDNAENDDASAPEIIESGYSSEKPSAVTSPVSLLELRSNDNRPYGFSNLNRDGDSSANDDKDDVDKLSLVDNKTTTNVTNGNTDHANFTLDVVNPAANEKASADNRNAVLNKTESLALSTSLTVNSDFTSPVSPLSSPLTSKDSPTSPMSSAVDGDDEKVAKLIPRVVNVHNNELRNKREEIAITKINTGSVGGTLLNEQNVAGSSKMNGIGDTMSNASKFELSSPTETPHGYSVKEGECSVQLCLNQFTALELMDGNNKVGCAACTERKNKGKKGVKMVCTESTKQYLISKVPAILILHLKRFQAQRYGFRKLGKHVSFPLILDLAPVTKDYTKPRIYSLYGIVEHSGTLHGGHYVAYVKARHPLKRDDPRWSFLPSKDGFESNTPNDISNDFNSKLESGETDGVKSSQIEPPPGRWYYVSDSSYHEVDEKTVLNSEAYLLFYERLV